MPASMKSLLAAKESTGLVSSVLGLWSGDKLHYRVRVTDCDMEARICQVVYEDGYKCWLDARDLHCELQLEQLKDEDIVCCICEGGESAQPNDIIMCDLCQQGYHLQCHVPAVDRTGARLDDEQSEWMCSTCQEIAGVPKKEEEEKGEEPVEMEVEVSQPGQLGCEAGRVEVMSPLLVETARAVAQRPSCIGTDDFVGLISEDKSDSEKCRPKRKTAPNKAKTIRTSIRRTAAAY